MNDQRGGDAPAVTWSSSELMPRDGDAIAREHRERDLRPVRAVGELERDLLKVVAAPWIN
ncbi:MAG: hypothetical protein KF773_39590 [Deltaproteobacteria bacterium]|nr:hypothetical protein [Deltaproteobacteria bacterium]